MKKFSAILLAFIVLSLAIVPTTAFAAEEKAFWVSHFNDGTSEGAGAIFTEVDSAGGWWIHVAFAPVDGVENTYEIVEISDGIAAGNGVALTVPEGGFVWAANTGNDYITLGIGDTDFTSPNCSNAIADAQTWVVGDKLTFNGLDLTGVIPTTTPDIRWYDDAYVCTATYAERIAGVNDQLPAEDSSDDSSATVPTGDATSMIVFAIIALVAVAGSAIVIKSRK